MIDSLLNLIKDKLQKQISDKIKNPGLQAEESQYITLQIPLENPIPLLAINIDQSFFLSKPDAALKLLGLGSLLNINAKGSQRFTTIQEQYTKILDTWQDKNITSPIAFHAFAFDENDPMTGHWSNIPNTLITFPLILIKELKTKQTLFLNIKTNTFNHIEVYRKVETLLNEYFKKVGQAFETNGLSEIITDKKQADWLALSKNAINEIHCGHFEKIVTSRQLSLTLDKNISTTQLIKSLTDNYPGCTIVSYHLSDKSIIAASPERLLTLEYPDIQSDAIGGTIHKKEHDSFILKQLTSFPLAQRNRLLKEHDFIVQAIYQGLDSLCHTLKMPVSPFLMKLHNMYHFETPLQGKLKNQ